MSWTASPIPRHPDAARAEAGSFSSFPSHENSADAVANIEEALQGAESDFAVRRAFECQMRRLDEIKEVFVPNVHLDDTPPTGKSLGEGGKLCH